MKFLIIAATLLALTIPAHAGNTQTCTGRVKIEIADGGGLNPKGTKELSVGDCYIEQSERVLRNCPKGSFCRVEGTSDGEALDLISVTRVHPYQEGVRDYRDGLCYRARPYLDDSEMAKLWERGYQAHQTARQGRRIDAYCHPKYEAP
jgi:hypothetical protein